MADEVKTEGDESAVGNDAGAEDNLDNNVRDDETEEDENGREADGSGDTESEPECVDILQSIAVRLSDSEATVLVKSLGLEMPNDENTTEERLLKILTTLKVNDCCTIPINTRKTLKL